MITIIVPYYCTKKEYYDACMKSLLKDKNADIEVLVVDDGSPSEYEEIITAFSEDHRVRILHESHKGVSNARNRGINEAAGEWLMFVDSDDYLEDDYYDALQKRIQNTDADFVFFNGFGEKDGQSIKNRYFTKENIDYGASVESKCQLIGSGLSLGRTPEVLRCWYTLGSPYSKLIRTAFLKESGVRFDTGVAFAEDTVFSFNLILKAEHIYYFDEYLYHYFLNAESVTGKYRKDLHRDMGVFFEKMWGLISSNGLKSNLEESYYIRAFLEAQRCIRQEFFHKQNPDPYRLRRAKTSAFIKSEPFRHALHCSYPYLRTFPCQMARMLLVNGWFNTYMLLYEGLAQVKKTYRQKGRNNETRQISD